MTTALGGIKVVEAATLFAAADRPDRVERASGSAAHAVIVDLEDAVAPQLQVIGQAYLPTEADAERARELLARGEGASALADGSFVDAAILRGARQLIALAERYGTRSEV